MQQHAYETPPPRRLRSIIFSIALLCTFFLTPALATAATINLSPGGSIQNAVNAANPGDIIYLRGGTHSVGSQITITRDGSSGNLIKLWAYPGEKPVIDAINQPSTAIPIYLQGANYWHIKGLEVKNGADGGIRADNSSNNIIENNNVHHSGRAGNAGKGIVLYYGGSNNLILNNDSHHNRDRSNGGADGFNLATNGSGNVWRDNRAWNNSDDGFDNFCIMDGQRCGAVLIENNWSFNNGKDDAGNSLGNGMGYKLGGVDPGTGGSDGGHTVRNNLAWGNAHGGFDDACSACTGSRSREATPKTLYNNTAWNNGSNYIFWVAPSTFRNNISFGTLGKITGTATNNSWNGGVTVSAADFQSMDDSCARGPRQADGSLPNCPFLHLVAGSDLIDKGTNVGIPFTGSAPDLGAFEFCTSNCPAFSPPGTLPGTPPPPPAGPHVELTITPACFANAEMNAFALAENPAANTDTNQKSPSLLDLLKKNLASALFFWRE